MGLLRVIWVALHYKQMNKIYRTVALCDNTNCINPNQDGGMGQKKTLPFFPISTKKVILCRQNFLTFSFDPLVTLV